MDIDVSSLLFGGFSALVILIFLIQTARETFNFDTRFIPVVGLSIALVMMILGTYLPERLVEAIAAAIALTAVASFTVRYVKNGEQDGNAGEGDHHLQGTHLFGQGSSRPQGARTTGTRIAGGSDRVHDSGGPRGSTTFVEIDRAGSGTGRQRSVHRDDSGDRTDPFPIPE